VSDPRLKIYAPYLRGLDAIMGLEPIHFHWNEEGRKISGLNANDTDAEQVGFNAENVQDVIPEAIGTETHDGVDYLNLPHGVTPIVAALVNSVQQQQSEIEELKREVMELKSH
jgi:hypothetical protein